MSSSENHPDEIVVGSSSDEEEASSDRDSDQEKILEIISTDSEDYCSDGESDSSELGKTSSTNSEESSDSDSGFSSRAPEGVKKAACLKITINDTSKRKPVKSELELQSCVGLSKAGGNCTSSKVIDRKNNYLHLTKHEDPTESLRGDASNPSDHGPICTEKNGEEIKYHNNEFRPNIKREQFTRSDGFLQNNKKQTVRHETDRTIHNKEINHDQISQGREPGVSINEEFDFLTMSQALKELLDVLENKAVHLDLLRTWFSREFKLAFSGNGLLMPLDDEEVQARNEFLSVGKKIPEFFDHASRLQCLPQCQHDNLEQCPKVHCMKGLAAYRMFLQEIDAKIIKVLLEAKSHAESTIEGITEGVKKAVDDIPGLY